MLTRSSDTDAVRVSAHVLNGALYVIVVSTTETTVQAKITVDGIAGRSLTVLEDCAVVGADAAGFSDTFGPLAARVYIAPPQGWFQARPRIEHRGPQPRDPGPHRRGDEDDEASQRMTDAGIEFSGEPEIFEVHNIIKR